MSPNETRLQEVVDLVPDVLFRCHKGPDGKIYWSLNEGGLAREFGLTTKEVEGKSLEELFAGGASQAIREHFEAAFEGETKPFVNELGGRYFKHFPQPVRDGDGNVTEVVGFISEVTELVAAKQRLQQANQALDDFAHSVSHDLRTPLTVLRNLIEAGRRSDMDPHLAGRMDETVQGMAGMIDAMLAFARSTGEPRRQRVDVSAIAREVATMLDATDADRPVFWEIESDMTCHSDPAMVRIVLQNLMGNAWKYTMERRPARIRVAHEGDAFVVKDNGTGFAHDDHRRIFRPFQRAAQGDGHGIGLATVERIVHRLGGHIEADGRPGKGATFTFTVEP